ncbi:TIGR04222 domain-containing membrane protein [Streptomyces sp. NBC_00555]|uniref:TIGR04222 domain-containing membrane protein n=1 Tax=Streptomyces sp. NBC_00555 TaxID=2903662 RepID=UPI00225485F2|nr:TIGR04222 domain-containing membrane protein [Streptomyces sp. NBC_00555]MCX5011079.1 TIGR04222 domain-containing membrane protein [Streptomyces sp. NBC_00555]
MNLLALAIWIAVATSSGLLLLGLYRARPRSAGPAPVLHDLSEAAFMAGGPGAVVDTALVSMLGDGRLMVGGPGIVQVRPGARAGDPAERAVLQAHRGAPSGWLYQVRYAAMLDPAVQETGDALAARGLISPPGWGRTWRRWGLIQATVCGLLVPVSLPLTFVAFVMDPDGQVPFIVKVLPVLLGGILVGALGAAAAGRRITPAGRRALREIRSHYVNDRTPHVQTALFGLRGLRDPFLRGQLVPAARGTRLAAAQSGSRPAHRSDSSSWSSAEILPVLWCAGSDGGGSGGGSGSGCGSGSSCGSSGGSSGGGCGSGSSSCSSGSSSSSSCSSSSGSSCSSSSGSSCSSSS